MKHFLTTALLLFCCCHETAPPPPIGDSDASKPPPHPPGSACGFTQSTFALPTTSGVSGAPFGALSGTTSCTNGTGSLAYQLLDMDGDGRADLLVTSTCDDPSVGVNAWLVFPSTASGFGAAQRFALPTFPAGCGKLALADVDGDLHLDLLVTSLCTDTSVGTTQWIVHRNTGSDFDANGTSFALPPGAASASFPSLEVDSPSCQAGHPAYAFYDVTGDAKADLVETAACDDATVGVAYWRVYPGDGAGVGAPITFGLPGGAAFVAPAAGDLDCQRTPVAPRYAVRDFDGDLAPDLVVTGSCVDALAGSTRWLVYANQKTSFATQPTTVDLPAFVGAPSGAYAALAGTTACTTGALTHAAYDVDGDLKPDLVVTRACGDPLTGVTQWLVYPNDGASFGAAAAYTLPAALGATSASPQGALTGALACGGTQQPAFGAAHLLGRELDVVLTSTCSDPGVGVSRWLTLAASCQ